MKFSKRRGQNKKPLHMLCMVKKKFLSSLSQMLMLCGYWLQHYSIPLRITTTLTSVVAIHIFAVECVFAFIERYSRSMRGFDKLVDDRFFFVGFFYAYVYIRIRFTIFIYVIATVVGYSYLSAVGFNITTRRTLTTNATNVICCAAEMLYECRKSFIE